MTLKLMRYNGYCSSNYAEATTIQSLIEGLDSDHSLEILQMSSNKYLHIELYVESKPYQETQLGGYL